jgi:hypothetical protein
MGGAPQWGTIGDATPGYRIDLDSLAAWNDRATWHLAHAGAPANKSAWMVRTVPAAPYVGKRIQIDLDVRTQGEPGEYDLRAQAMSRVRNGPLVHTRIEPIAGFRHTTLVMDVPEGAGAIVLGPGAVSPGEVWVSDSAITVVDSSVPLTMPPSPVVGDWHMFGAAHLLYEPTADPAAKRADTVPVRVHGTTRPFPGYVGGTFTTLPATTLQGKTVRASVWIRSAGATDAECDIRVEAGLSWTTGRAAGHHEPLASTSDWHLCTGEFKVPEVAGWIFVGAKFQGTGDVWLDAPTVSVVEAGAP